MHHSIPATLRRLAATALIGAALLTVAACSSDEEAEPTATAEATVEAT